MIYDYEGILTELKTRLSLLSNWASISYHGTYERILSVIAYIIDKFVYLAEFLYRESNWVLAQKISSLMTQTEFLSYDPHRKKGASGDALINAVPYTDSEYSSYKYLGESVIIPQWTEITDETGNVTVYTTESSIYYKNAEGPLTVPVKQGIPKEFVYIANGTANEIIKLYSNTSDEDEIYVYIVDENNTILHTVKRCKVDTIDNVLIDRLFFVDDLTYYYCEIRDSKDFDYVTIKFGDGITTKKLELGTRVLIKYAETDGNEGNIESAYTLSKFKAPLYDANGDEATLYVTNFEAISDGSAIEDIESIRNNASNLFSTGYRCGGYNDWKVNLENKSGIVYKAKIWSTDDIADDTITANQNKVYITAVSSSGDALTTAQQESLTTDFLKPIKSPTELVSWQPLKKLYAIFRGTAIVTNLPFPTIRQKINDTLDDHYAVLNVDFKQNIASSNFTAVIDDLDEIISHETQIYHMEKISSGISFNNHTIIPSYTVSDTTTITDQVYILAGSVEIWHRLYSGDLWQDPVQVAYDDNTGNLVSMNGFTLTNTAITYTSNQVSCTITNPEYQIPSSQYEVSLIYITKDGNGNKINDMRLPTFDIITDTDPDYNSFTFTYQL